MDQHTCMVEVARFFMSFTQRESCGKCVPCREGTKRMLEILEKIVEGRGEEEDLDRLEELAAMIRQRWHFADSERVHRFRSSVLLNYSETNIWNISTSINVPQKSVRLCVNM